MSLVGHLCLGPKTSGEPFRTLDRDLLATLSRHLATFVRNIQLADDLRRKLKTLDTLNDRLEHAREAERSRLAADLHDEPLQTALQGRFGSGANRGRAEGPARRAGTQSPDSGAEASIGLASQYETG